MEIGTGTGYNAALLSHIAGAEGQVVTIELDEDTVNFAREHLSAAGFDRVQVICGDGASGFAGAAPYDRIILSVGASDIHPAWREQLKPKGRLVLPLSIRVAQESVAFEPAGDHLRSVSIKDCSFMLLRGPNAAPERMIQLHPLPDLRIAIHSEAAIDAQTTQQQLAGSSQDWPTDIHVKPEEIWGGLNLWLALGEPGYCDVWSEGTERLLPDLFRLSETMGLTTGLISRNGLCVLMRSPNSSPDKPEAAPLGLAVRSYGADDALRLRLLDHIHAWDAAGRPGSDRLKIRAYSLPSHHRPSPSEIVIDKQYTQLVLAW